MLIDRLKGVLPGRLAPMENPRVPRADTTNGEMAEASEMIIKRCIFVAYYG